MDIKRLIKKIPPIETVYGYIYWRKHYQKLFKTTPPGHFYSPLPDISWVCSNTATLYPENQSNIPGIDLRETYQKELFYELAQYFDDFKFPEEPSDDFRYYSDNTMFGLTSGMILFAMIQHFKPKRVIEIGSGHSSALMLDTNDRYMSGAMEFTFIEPYPQRLYSLLRDDDNTKCTVFAKPAQDIPASFFDQLQENDLLFIDSSHVTKIGSDVNHIFFNILPSLKPGVIIHFHDIYWPFEYPLSWIEEGRAWNEAYLLRAFLQFNANFEIALYNHYLCTCFPELFQKKTDQTGSGSSIWIRKKG